MNTCLSEKKVGEKTQNIPLVNIAVCREALCRIVDLEGRLFELEFEFEEIKRVLREELEKIS